MQSQTQMRLQLAGGLRSHTHTHSDNVPRSHHFRVARQDEVYLENRLPVARPLSRDSHPRASAWRPCPGLQTFSPDGAGSSLSHSHSHCPLPILNHLVARQDMVFLENRLPVARPPSHDSHPSAAAWRPCHGLQTVSNDGAVRYEYVVTCVRVDWAWR